MQTIAPIKAVKERYDLFFLRFYTLYFQQVLQQDRTFDDPRTLPVGAIDCFMAGWREINSQLQTGNRAYVMLSDRMCAGVKINIYISQKDSRWEIQFEISPTYLRDKLRKKSEKKVIPILQAAKFEVKYP